MSMTSIIAYAENIPTTLTLEVEHTVVGDTPSTDEVFYFEIASTNGPLPEETVVEITGSGTVSFGEIIYDAPGVFYYTVSQIAGQDSDYTYSDVVYDITVYITSDDSGVLTLAMVVATDQDTELKVPELTFESVYDDPDDDSTNTPDPDDPAIDPEDPTVDPDDPDADLNPDDPTIDPDDPTADPEDPTVDSEDPTVDPEDPTVYPEDSDVDIDYPDGELDTEELDPEGLDPEELDPEDSDDADPGSPSTPSSGSDIQGSTEETEDPFEGIPTVQLGDEEIPLYAPFGTSAWALVNLILTVLTFLGSLALAITYFIKKKDPEEEEDEEEIQEEQDVAKASTNTDTLDEDEEEEEGRKLKKHGKTRICSGLWAILTIIAFILTEDTSLPMVFIDAWTILMLVLAIVQLILMLHARKRFKDEEEEEDEEDEEEADVAQNITNTK